MRISKRKSYFSLLIFVFCFVKSIAQYDLAYKIISYQEIADGSELCKNTIPDKLYFTIDTPIKIFGEEVDSFFVYKWDRLNLSLGKKGSKEFDMLVPLNSDLQKSRPTENLPDFSISYKIEGNIGQRIITVQWKNVIPAYLTKPTDAFNFQVILYEKDQSVQYVFGSLPGDPYIFFIFGSQERLMSIYFMDDFTSLSDPIFKFFYAFSDYPIGPNTIGGYYSQSGGYHEDRFFSYIGGSLVLGSSFHFIFMATSTSEQPQEKISIYPNPSSDFIYLSNNISKDIYEIQVTDFIGKSYTVEKTNDAIDINQLPSGMYVLSFWDRGKIIESKTFVKN